MNLEDARLFVAVAAADSLSDAGRRIGRSPAAVSAALKRLEGLTQVRLLQRSTRAMALTPEGRDFQQTCEALVQTWEDGQRRLAAARGGLSGSLRISAPVDIAQQHVASMVADFVDQHPGVRVTLLVADAWAALPGDDVDVVLRYGRLDDSALVGTRIGGSMRLVVAAPHLLEREEVDDPRRLLELPTLAWLAHERPFTRWVMARRRDEATIDTKPVLCGDGALVRHWCLEGRGFAWKSRVDVIDDLEAGRLVDVFPDWRGESIPITALMPAGRMRSVRVQALVEHLRRGLRSLLSR